MTDEQLQTASAGEQDMALLSGRRALWALFVLTMLGSAFSVILMLQSWMGVTDPQFVGALGLGLCSTAGAFLAPHAMRAAKARELAESEAHRRALLDEVKVYRELLAQIPKEPQS